MLWNSLVWVVKGNLSFLPLSITHIHLSICPAFHTLTFKVHSEGLWDRGGVKTFYFILCHLVKSFNWDVVFWRFFFPLVSDSLGRTPGSVLSAGWPSSGRYRFSKLKKQTLIFFSLSYKMLCVEKNLWRLKTDLCGSVWGQMLSYLLFLFLFLLDEISLKENKVNSYCMWPRVL